MAFAKLFETVEFGQILVKLGEHEDGSPEIRWYAEPPMLGICEFAVLYEDNDEGHRKAEEILSGLDEEMAKQVAGMMCSKVNDFFPSLAGE